MGALRHHGETPFEFVPRYNIAPTQPIAVVREPHKLELLRWGLKLPTPRAGGFNVRVESLGAPFYRDSIDGRRCLIRKGVMASCPLSQRIV